METQHIILNLTPTGHYKVVSLMNRLDPEIGSYLSEAEARKYLFTPNLDVMVERSEQD